MPQPYSADLRRRVVHAIEQQQMRTEEAADTFQVSPSFVEKLLRRWRTAHTVTPRPHGGGVASPLAAVHEPLRTWIAEQPDRTLDELKMLLAEHHGVATSRPALSRVLTALGLPRKKSR